MKRSVASLSVLLCLNLCLAGCQSVGDKTASLSVIYGATAVLSMLVLGGYGLFVKKKDGWLLLLLSSVVTVNGGYWYLALSHTLDHALMANRIAYLGSVLLPLSMFMIILKVTNTTYKKWLPGMLFAISGLVFLVAASPGILDVYYKEVSFAVVNGVTTLDKVYGPLHPLYLFFLLVYFSVMVAAIIKSAVKKTIDTTTHAIILAVAVFVNIGVWLIEQLANIEFEMLSVSYIISELFLLGVNLVAGENKRLKQLVKEAEISKKITALDASAPDRAITPTENTVTVDQKQIDLFLTGLEHLTQTEKRIFDSYIARFTTKEVLASLNIKENTLKFHNKNIYSKLGVSSRKELLEIYKQMKALSPTDSEAAQN